MALCMEDEMINLVKPEKQSQWAVASAKWFVQDHTDAWDLRCPGKMKLEWATTNGAFVA